MHQTTHNTAAGSARPFSRVRCRRSRPRSPAVVQHVCSPLSCFVFSQAAYINVIICILLLSPSMCFTIAVPILTMHMFIYKSVRFKEYIFQYISIYQYVLNGGGAGCGLWVPILSPSPMSWLSDWHLHFTQLPAPPLACSSGVPPAWRPLKVWMGKWPMRGSWRWGPWSLVGLICDQLRFNRTVSQNDNDSKYSKNKTCSGCVTQF